MILESTYISLGRRMMETVVKALPDSSGTGYHFPYGRDAATRPICPTLV